MHYAIVGKTGTGKTTLARQLCKAVRSKRVITAVLDERMDQRWGADFITDNVAAFLHFLKTHKGVWFCVDESGISLDKWDESLHWLATYSRNLGHAGHFCCQRIVQLAPTIRDNLGGVFLFQTNAGSMAFLADEFRRPQVKMVNLAFEPKKYAEFLKLSNSSEISKYKLDFKSQRVIKLSASLN